MVQAVALLVGGTCRETIFYRLCDVRKASERALPQFRSITFFFRKHLVNLG